MKKIILTIVMLLSVSLCFAKTLMEDLDETKDWFLKFYNGKGNYVIIYNTDGVTVISKEKISFMEFKYDDFEFGTVIILGCGESSPIYLKISKYNFTIDDKSGIMIIKNKKLLEEKKN